MRWKDGGRCELEDGQCKSWGAGAAALSCCAHNATKSFVRNAERPEDDRR
jgi:hypothetical protein